MCVQHEIRFSINFPLVSTNSEMCIVEEIFNLSWVQFWKWTMVICFLSWYQMHDDRPKRKRNVSRFQSLAQIEHYTCTIWNVLFVRSKYGSAQFSTSTTQTILFIFFFTVVSSVDCVCNAISPREKKRIPNVSAERHGKLMRYTETIGIPCIITTKRKQKISSQRMKIFVKRKIGYVHCIKVLYRLILPLHLSRKHINTRALAFRYCSSLSSLLPNSFSIVPGRGTRIYCNIIEAIRFRWWHFQWF